jgi:hypothetical protein
MSNKKNLLNENTIRRMMKLASVDTLSDTFISTKYAPLAENKPRDAEEDERMGMEDGPEKDKEVSMKGRRDDKYGKFGKRDKEDRKDTHNLEEEINENEEEEKELGATEDELSDMDSEADRERDELEADDEAMEDEVTLTDDEARDIIALADKLRAAMGEEEMEGAMDAMDDAEDEMDDAMDAMDAAMDDEPGMGNYRMEEELFEAALKGLDIEIVEDKKVQLENLSKEIYKKVVARLLQESKK